MAYRADIEIGVKGQEAIGRLQKQLDGTLYKINELNKTSVFRTGNVAQNIDRYTKQLNLAAKALDLAALGTTQETRAINNYVTAVGQANTARERQTKLIDAEIKKRQELERIQKLTAAGIFETTRFKEPIGPALPPSVPSTKGFPSSPIGGGLNMPGSPAARAAKNQRLESIALGVGFPLLFGGGAGSVGGSLAGSFVGSGFGGQILGGAIGQAIDQFNLKTQELGKALNPLTGDFDKVIAAAGLTGTATANYIKELESEQGSKVALAAATKELAKVIGDSGVQALRRYGDAATNLANAWEVAITQIRAASADLLAGLLEGVTNTLTRANAFRQAGVTTNDPQLESLKKQFDAADRGRLFGGDQGEALRIRELIIDRQIQINKETEKNIGIVDKVTAVSKNQIALLENKLKISKTNGDILNTEVFELEKLSIQQEYRVQLAELLAKKEYEVADVYALQLQRNISLNELNRKRAEAAKTAQETSARKAKQAADEENGVIKSVASIRKDLLSVTLDGINAQYELDTLYKGEYAVLKDRIKNAQNELDLKQLILGKEEEAALAGVTDARVQAANVQLYDQKNKLLGLQAAIQNKINVDKARELKYTQDIADIQSKGTLKVAGSQAAADIAGARGNLARSLGGTGFEFQQQQLDAQQQAQRDALATRLEAINRLQKDIPNLKGDNLEKAQKTLSNDQAQYAIDLQRLDTLSAIEQQQLRVNQVTEQYGGIANAVGTAFSTSFKGIIDGSMTAREALGSFFQSVADAFLDMAAQIIAKWIQMTILNTILSIFPGGAKAPGSGFDMGSINKTGLTTFNPGNGFPGLVTGSPPGLATGGPAMANTPYIVGEKGPELFMPGRSGTVIPNDALGGSGTTNVVVNVDASGSNVQGDQAQAKQLGVVVSAAVQAELVKQQRPGGLLAGTRR